MENSDGYRGEQGTYGGGYQRADGRGYGGYRGRGNYDGQRSFRPSPVKIGEQYDVKIESLSRRGDSGVARVQGLVVFVPNSNVGDAVTVKITRVGQGYATGEIVGKDTEALAQPSTETSLNEHVLGSEDLNHNSEESEETGEGWES